MTLTLLFEKKLQNNCKEERKHVPKNFHSGRKEQYQKLYTTTTNVK
jgi:hypothetical protein